MITLAAERHDITKPPKKFAVHFLLMNSKCYSNFLLWQKSVPKEESSICSLEYVESCKINKVSLTTKLFKFGSQQEFMQKIHFNAFVSFGKEYSV
jgi:hypothetical protein